MPCAPYHEYSQRPHRMKVIKSLYHPGGIFTRGDFLCETENGHKVNIDLFIDGSLPDEITWEAMIGRTVEVSHSSAFLWMGAEVRLVDAEEVSA